MTPEERKTVVTLHKGEDGARFMEEMSHHTGNGFIPDRKVEVYNEKPQSISNYDFVLSMEEAKALKDDPRVRDVRWGTKAQNGIFPVNQVEMEPSSYRRTQGNDTTTDRNWALYTMREGYDEEFEAGEDNHEYGYTLTGENVDAIIMDDGIEWFHPEFLNPDGSSRVELIDWPEESGLTNIFQDPAYYTANTQGHGTHCASIIGGNTYGWARKASLYSMAVVGQFGNAPPSWMFGISDAFNMIRGFHLNKADATRPTIVNMSWAYFRNWQGFDAFRYRGTWYSNRNGEFPDAGTLQDNGFNPAPEYGMRSFGHPLRVTSVDSDIEDCIEAGVLLVGASMNANNYIEIPNGPDWNNFYEYDDFFGQYYWQRGGTPMGNPGVYVVGNVDWSRPFVDGYRDKNRMQSASGRGPGVDIFAPGSAIGGAVSTFNGFESVYPSRPYPENPNFKMTKLTGTSFAAPQVVGIVAQELELRPDLTYREMRQWLEDNAEKGNLLDETVGDPSIDYRNDDALHGAPNLLAKNPYRSGTVERYSGDIEISK